ncbi:neutral/alkaline non-lysosomal ceramidase, partial [Helicosporidium sp. ATCC 50920]
FAAGTTDGPGAFDFTQGDTNGTAFWRAVRAFLHAPTAEQEACHSPKPILLDVGHMQTPYDWAPSIVEISILRAGSFAILCVPAEFTTMAGRRLRRAVADEVGQAWGPDLQLVIAGLTNTYASYVTTFEEYAQQRYEGGFTLFGPSTLDAYIQEFKALARAMVDGTETPPGPAPPDLVPRQWSLLPPVVVDAPGWGTPFGGVLEDVQPQVVRGKGVARALFQSACPRNELRTESSFLTVERRAPGSSEWVAVATDDAWETRFRWTRPETLSPTSHAEIEWVVPADAEPGVYRLGHAGDHKPLFGGVQPFQGYSSEFQVLPEPDETKNQPGHWWQEVVNSVYSVFSWRG